MTAAGNQMWNVPFYACIFQKKKISERVVMVSILEAKEKMSVETAYC